MRAVLLAVLVLLAAAAEASARPILVAERPVEVGPRIAGDRIAFWTRTDPLSVYGTMRLQTGRPGSQPRVVHSITPSLEYEVHSFAASASRMAYATTETDVDDDIDFTARHDFRTLAPSGRRLEALAQCDVARRDGCFHGRTHDLDVSGDLVAWGAYSSIFVRDHGRSPARTVAVDEPTALAFRLAGRLIAVWRSKPDASWEPAEMVVLNWATGRELYRFSPPRTIRFRMDFDLQPDGRLVLSYRSRSRSTNRFWLVSPEGRVRRLPFTGAPGTTGSARIARDRVALELAQRGGGTRLVAADRRGRVLESLHLARRSWLDDFDGHCLAWADLRAAWVAPVGRPPRSSVCAAR